MATMVARRPTTTPLASISTHFFVTSAGFAENVFICCNPERGNRRADNARPNWRSSKDHRRSRQRLQSKFMSAKTIAYNYGVIIPQKSLFIRNGIGGGDMGNGIDGF